MARTIQEIHISLVNYLVTYAASLGITINPDNWVYVPGSLSETDYKLLLLNTIENGLAYEEQLNDLFQTNQELLIKSASPQTKFWFQNQMINLFQWNATDTQIPIIIPPSIIPVFDPVNDQYKVISFCVVEFASAGRCLIKVAAKDSNNLPADLDTTVGAGALDAAQAFINELAAPGISYIVSSGMSDWLFLQLDVYFNGSYSSVIFQRISDAITSFLNNLSIVSLSNNSTAIVKLSALEDAILHVQGVNDVVFVNVAGRPDANEITPGSTTWGTSQQLYIITSGTENARQYQTKAGYIAVENGTSTGGAIPNSKLSDYRVGSSGILNLNCIAE